MSFKGTTPKDDEILGKYNLGQLIIDVKDVKDENKIKFKQGIVKAILTKKSVSNNYSAKAWIFGIIPIRMKGAEFQFEKLNNKFYFKQVYTKSKSEYYLGKKKTSNLPIPESWKSMCGKHELTGEIYTAKDNTLWDVSDLKATVSEENGVLKLDVKSKSQINGTFYFDIISDTSAVLGGIGRGRGDVARILENGNLYYSGFEFSKTK